MALELKLQEVQNVNVGQDLQGFVCLSWKSPFQKYIDNCFLTKIQVVLEGYIANHPSSKLSIGKKFYSHELFCVKGIYGENRLGKLFPKRSLVYPFILSPPQQQYMIPSCRSEKMINVTYRLKTRVILREPGEHRTPDQAFSSLTSLLPYWVPVKPTSNSTMETIAQTKKIKSIQRQSSTEDGSVTVTGSLSDWIAKEASQVEAFVKLDLHPQASQISHISGILIQECSVAEGVSVVQKQAKLFNIRIDKTEQTGKQFIDLSIPFNLPPNLIPTVIEKDQRAKVSYHVYVSVHAGKKEETSIELPIVVVVG